MSWLGRNKAPDFWVELTGDCFVASVAVCSGHVIEAAPILAYMNGWTLQKVKEHCKNKKWRYEEKGRLDDPLGFLGKFKGCAQKILAAIDLGSARLINLFRLF